MAINRYESRDTNREDLDSSRLNSPALHSVTLSTQEAPERDRLELFRENFNNHLYRAEVEDRSKGAFEGEIKLLRAGSVGIARITACPSNYARTRRHLSDFDDSVTLFVGISRGLAIEQATLSHKFGPGTGFLYQGGLPGAASASTPVELWGIKVPSARITSRMALGCGRKPVSVSAELPAMQLINQYLNSYSTVASSEPELCEAFGTHLVDLLMLIVGTDRDTLELIEGRGLKAARTAGILDAITKHFSVPDLTADVIGLKFCITGRQVHRLLEGTTKTFYEHLLERRLREAHLLLTDSDCSELKIDEIARRVGFNNRAYFHRVFRTRFGGTPVDVRVAALRETKRFRGASP
jgi:AraC-like DNA-binding protein